VRALANTIRLGGGTAGSGAGARRIAATGRPT
jgi:hypothetical protein